LKREKKDIKGANVKIKTISRKPVGTTVKEKPVELAPIIPAVTKVQIQAMQEKPIPYRFRRFYFNGRD
jgi:hypothetical protein